MSNKYNVLQHQNPDGENRVIICRSQFSDVKIEIRFTYQLELRYVDRELNQISDWLAGHDNFRQSGDDLCDEISFLKAVGTQIFTRPDLILDYLGDGPPEPNQEDDDD